MPATVLPGKPYPLGAKANSKGTNFAIYSECATAVFVCLFDQNGRETERIELKEKTAHVWHGLVKGIRTGQLYGFRVDGPWAPEQGKRFNVNKLLVDPYARAISGQVDWNAPIFSYPVLSGDDLQRDDQDSAAGVPKCVVIEQSFNWEGDCPPQIPLADSVIYELHVKGFSKLNEKLPEKLRGTYAGLAHPASIEYLQSLGVTAIELLPVHHFIDEGHLVERGLKNYWGYNTLGYFAPEVRYSSSGDRGGQVHEFKEMVKALHRAGIEVILDVVYNHTCEGNEKGPTLSFRGICNSTYYRTVPDNPRFYMDYTGTGNTLNVRHPQVLKLIMDSLRYWVTEMHVDGFRFDLAAALARELHDVDRLSGFFDTIHQDPILADVKLIAEPWDVGEGGYQVGNFPVLWAEWNGRYRDTVRRYWKGDEGQLSDFAHRLTGSSDLYQYDGRRPYASINFVTAHDGFTLNDLVSYNCKHNEANGDENSDGTDANYSWNMGAEGPTEDEAVNVLRERQMRNLLATLILSQGVPMIAGGDEVSRTQQGNNNGYCQDSELTWMPWKWSDEQQRLLAYTQKLIHLRREHPNLHRRKFFQDRKIRGSVVRDVAWYGPDGKELSDEVWNTHWMRSLAMMLNGQTLAVCDDDGKQIVDDSFLLMVNAAEEGVEFKLPLPVNGRSWKRILYTEDDQDPFQNIATGESAILAGRSLMLFSDWKQ